VSTWIDGELRHFGAAIELQLASRRDDGTLRPYTTMWVVRVGDDLYISVGRRPEPAVVPARPRQSDRPRPR